MSCPGHKSDFFRSSISKAFKIDNIQKMCQAQQLVASFMIASQTLELNPP